MSNTSPTFLGLDASTQSLKASLLSSDLDVISEVAINFDADLPQYKTKGGVLNGPAGSGEVFSPVSMIVEAMDLLFEKIKAAKWETSRVRGVSAAGQQHASVYWSRAAPQILSSIDPSHPLSSQFDKAFSRPIVPNWQDSSTTSECRAMEAALGGPEALALSTGSKAHERFTGAQIMRFKRIDPQAYENTERISIVSSFITTLLCLDGEIKGIDESDACGMNLWDMKSPSRGWNKDVLGAIVGEKEGGGVEVEELERKLGKVKTDGGKVVGRIGDWFVKRYGFDPECCVFPGTGDNPATFLSRTLRINEGLISLGTSDVIIVSTEEYNPHPEYHAFFHPAQIAPPSCQDTDKESQGRSNTSLRYFNMLVYKNGSLAREHVRDQYYNKSWDQFNEAVQAGRPTKGDEKPNEAAFWWLLPDIIPDGASGIHKYTTNGSLDPIIATKVGEFSDPSTNALRILESQFLNYRSRASAILRSADSSSSSNGGGELLTRVYAAGGAAKNETIISLASDILNAPICKNVELNPDTGVWSEANWNSCSVGVAYKARWGWERNQAPEGSSRRWMEFDEMIKECRNNRAATRREREKAARRGKGEVVEVVNTVTGDDNLELEEEGIAVTATPGEGAKAYEGWVGWWRGLEARALEGK